MYTARHQASVPQLPRSILRCIPSNADSCMQRVDEHPYLMIIEDQRSSFGLNCNYFEPQPSVTFVSNARKLNTVASDTA